MHAVVRNYSGAGAKQLFDLLEQRKDDVEAVIRKVPGLMSYTLLRSGDGGVSVTVCQDKAGADESLKVARDWIQKNASNTGASPICALRRWLTFSRFRLLHLLNCASSSPFLCVKAAAKRRSPTS